MAPNPCPRNEADRRRPPRTSMSNPLILIALGLIAYWSFVNTNIVIDVVHLTAKFLGEIKSALRHANAPKKLVDKPTVNKMVVTLVVEPNYFRFAIEF
jgi:hypothetical protein